MVELYSTRSRLQVGSPRAIAWDGRVALDPEPTTRRLSQLPKLSFDFGFDRLNAIGG